MKLILTQEVSGLGAPGDIVEVKDGYGRNFLDPARFRDPLDQGRREARSTRSRPPAARARSATSTRPRRSRPRSRARPVDVPVRAGEGGRLFGAVTVSDIADAINRSVGGSCRRRRQAQDPGRQPDQVARRAPGHRARSTTSSRRPSTSTSCPPDPVATAERAQHRTTQPPPVRRGRLRRPGRAASRQGAPVSPRSAPTTIHRSAARPAHQDHRPAADEHRRRRPPRATAAPVRRSVPARPPRARRGHEEHGHDEPARPRGSGRRRRRSAPRRGRRRPRPPAGRAPRRAAPCPAARRPRGRR